MAISDETLRIAGRYRLEVGKAVDDEARALVKAWATAWDLISAEWEQAIADVLNAGDRPTLAQVRRLARAQDAMRATVRSLDQLVADMGARIVDAAGEIVQLTTTYEPQLIASQYPPNTVLAVRFDRVDQKALEAIVRRTTQQVTVLTWPLTAQATDAMLRELVRGIGQGRSPRDTAARILRAVEGDFNGGLARALNIARTELLDAYRAASLEHHQANTDVLDGWVWSARLDTTCCPSCWAQHGTVHPVTEPGPLDHQSGRCARMPKTKSWADLGFAGITEPASAMPDARALFSDLPEADQLRIMGPTRLAGLNDGSVAWEDLSTRRVVQGWRDSFGVTPVKALTAAEARAVAGGLALSEAQAVARRAARARRRGRRR